MFPPQSKNGVLSSINISHIEHSLDGLTLSEVTDIAFALFLDLLPPTTPLPPSPQVRILSTNNV